MRGEAEARARNAIERLSGKPCGYLVICGMMPMPNSPSIVVAANADDMFRNLYAADAQKTRFRDLVDNGAPGDFAIANDTVVVKLGDQYK